MAALGRVLYRAWYDVPADPTTRFDGKTVLVTGANTGIGLEAAIKLTKLGAAKVIVGVRDVNKANATKKAIEARTKRTGVVQAELLDMGDYESIRNFVAEVEKVERLDAVILNAGVLPTKLSTSQYGWGQTVQVNTISTVYLALLLLPLLKRSSAKHGVSHLEFVGSGTYRFAKIDENRRDGPVLESYNSEQDFNARPAYAFSKFALYCANKELAEALGDNPDVLVINVCPGMVATNLSRGYKTSFAFRALLQLFRLISRSPEQGGRTLVRGLTLGKEAHGRFWQDDKVQTDAGLLAGDDSEKIRKQLWHDILAALQKDVPNIQELVPRSSQG